MQVSTQQQLAEHDVAALYPLYLASFEQLLTRAAARHVLSSSEFADEMADPRIDKIVVRDGDRLLAMTTLTTELRTVAWINPTYFATAFPDAAARGAVFYLGYTLVEPARRRSNALLLMASEVNRRLVEAQGVIAYDICSFNDAHGVGRLTAKIFSRAQEIRPMDTQTYYVADYRDAPAQADGLHRPPERTTRVTTLRDRPDLVTGVRRLLDELWPVALRPEGSDLGLAAVVERAAARQVLLIDENDRVQAAALCLPAGPAHPTGSLVAGWDEAVRRGAGGTGAGDGAGPVLALPLVPSTGLYARTMTEAVLHALRGPARTEGATTLLAAVRPARKERYPLFSLPEYLSWRNDRDEPLDPEVRTHLRLGGEVVATSEPGTSATRQQWERRLGRPLPADGSYVVDGAAAPLVLSGGTGRYHDPQVWVAHPTDPALVGPSTAEGL